MIVPLIPIAILIDDRCQDLRYAYTMPDNSNVGTWKAVGNSTNGNEKEIKQAVHRHVSNIVPGRLAEWA